VKTLLIWLLIVLALSVYPFEDAGVSFAYADKVLHFIIYAITGVLLYTVLMERPSLRRRAAILSVVIASGYGLLMEVLQLYVPSREFSLLDAATNALGAVCGMVFIVMKRRRK
jgi:VanZ family protein